MSYALKVEPFLAGTDTLHIAILTSLGDLRMCNYTGNSSSYSGKVPGDARQSLHYLQAGLLRERDRHACWEREERHADDIDPPKPI
jgi:hypothetical protein